MKITVSSKLEEIKFQGAALVMESRYRFAILICDFSPLNLVLRSMKWDIT